MDILILVWGLVVGLWKSGPLKNQVTDSLGQSLWVQSVRQTSIGQHLFSFCKKFFFNSMVLNCGSKFWRPIFETPLSLYFKKTIKYECCCCLSGHLDGRVEAEKAWSSWSQLRSWDSHGKPSGTAYKFEAKLSEAILIVIAKVSLIFYCCMEILQDILLYCIKLYSISSVFII